MTNKLYKWVTVVMLVVASALSLSSCGNDEPDEVTLIGTWEFSNTVSDEDGTSSLKMVLTFKSNNTGSIVETWSTKSKASSNETYSMNFSWATATDANGNDIMKISYVSGDKNTELFYGYSNTALWQRQYVLTGKILNIYDGDGVWVFNKK